MDRSDAETPIGLAPEDFYLEGGTIVFTEAYHLKRGDCCGSGCRHCPYEHRKVPGAAKNQRAEGPEDAAAPDAG
jgi:hypothetical protein